LDRPLDESGGEPPFNFLVDGVSLPGWRPAPRVCGAEYPGGPSVLELFDHRGIPRPDEPEKHPARWHVEDGAIIAEPDTAALQSPNYDADAVSALLGEHGHIALEVHDNDAMFGEARWGVGAPYWWRNIRIKDLAVRSVEAQ
jgi:hypothetical protein